LSVLMAIVEDRDTIRRALAIAIVALARAERCPYSEPGSQKMLAKKMKMLLETLADDDLSLAMPGMMVVYHLKTLPRAVSSYAQNRCEPLTAGAPMERGTPPGEAAIIALLRARVGAAARGRLWLLTAASPIVTMPTR
jgi:hypothetical protein